MKYTLLTDVKVKFSGGAAPVQTVSDKHVTCVNQYLSTQECSNILQLIMWAGILEQAKQVNMLQKEYPDKVERCKVMLAKAKILYKERKNANTVSGLKIFKLVFNYIYHICTTLLP